MTGLGPLGASVTLSPPVHTEDVSWGFSLHCLGVWGVGLGLQTVTFLQSIHYTGWEAVATCIFVYSPGCICGLLQCVFLAPPRAPSPARPAVSGGRSPRGQLLPGSGGEQTGLHCTALYCTVLHCTAWHCTALHCTALHCIALHCTALYCTALHCTALH